MVLTIRLTIEYDRPDTGVPGNHQEGQSDEYTHLYTYNEFGQLLSVETNSQNRLKSTKMILSR